MPAPDPSFPIGGLTEPAGRDRPTLDATARRMQAATADWHDLLAGLHTPALGRTYRPGSWTVQQLVHHVADAHVHGLQRLRYALTTPDYVIQPFDQDAWLTLPDAGLPVTVALTLLDGATAHWAALLGHVPPEQFGRRITHPQEGPQDLWRLTAKHDWHLRHHLAQARLALESSG